MNNENPTICAQCQFFWDRGPVWYDMLCKAVRLPEQVDFVTGRKTTSSGEHFAYARDINTDGCCHLYKPLGNYDCFLPR